MPIEARSGNHDTASADMTPTPSEASRCYGWLARTTRPLGFLALATILTLAGCANTHTVEVTPKLGSANLISGVEMTVPVGGTRRPDGPPVALCLRDAAGQCLTGRQVLGWGLLAAAVVGIAIVTFDKDDLCDDWPNGWYSPLEARRGPQGQFTCNTNDANERGEWLCACLTDV